MCLEENLDNRYRSTKKTPYGLYYHDVLRCSHQAFTTLQDLHDIFVKYWKTSLNPVTPSLDGLCDLYVGGTGAGEVPGRALVGLCGTRALNLVDLHTQIPRGVPPGPGLGPKARTGSWLACQTWASTLNRATGGSSPPSASASSSSGEIFGHKRSP
ncbi:hypothetical protein CRG98_026063 [Punica granatum]|uniref:Uncharacterized protein n=1 Tax=Punica granatum TaxID=22663 RepID=A0A2I0JBA8_PUNGR|nr:hypothetical protein CRG98_026063 [Punica granatum]